MVLSKRQNKWKQTIFLGLVMLSISVFGSAECACCAFEATIDFTIYLLYLKNKIVIIISLNFREIVGCFIGIHRNSFWDGNRNQFMIAISNNITNSKNMIQYKIELANLARSYGGLRGRFFSNFVAFSQYFIHTVTNFERT